MSQVVKPDRSDASRFSQPREGLRQFLRSDDAAALRCEHEAEVLGRVPTLPARLLKAAPSVRAVGRPSRTLAAANDVPAGLTAGIFTGRRAEAVSFLDRIEAGCINVNARGHATTGFWPGRETFGGWKASGSTGKQAYGKWYLQQFTREQTRKFPADLAGLS